MGEKSRQTLPKRNLWCDDIQSYDAIMLHKKFDNYLSFVCRFGMNVSFQSKNVELAICSGSNEAAK